MDQLFRSNLANFHAIYRRTEEVMEVETFTVFGGQHGQRLSRAPPERLVVRLLTLPSDASRHRILPWAVLVGYCRRQPAWSSAHALRESSLLACVEVSQRPSSGSYSRSAGLKGTMSTVWVSCYLTLWSGWRTSAYRLEQWYTWAKNFL